MHLTKDNEHLDPHERLDFLALVPEQWSVESGLAIPALKLKRNVIESHYADHFQTGAKQRKIVGWNEA